MSTSTSNMTSRQRVIAAYNHQEPDRVPICLGGTAQKFCSSVYLAVKDHLGIDDDYTLDQSLDELGNVIHYHPKVLEFFDSDFRHIQINRVAPEGPDENGVMRHELGFGLKTDEETGITHMVGHPWQGASAAEIEAWKMPDPNDPFRVAGLAEQARSLRENTEYAIAAYKAALLGVFDLACVMRGMDTFLMDMLADPPAAGAALDRTLEFNYGVYSAMLDAVGPFIDVVEFNDDLGTQDNMMFSPDMYRDMLKPRHAEFVAMLHKKAPQAKVFLHCCGSVRPIIGDLIEIGVDVLNPIQPLARGMDPAELKAEFGSDISFQGAIDVQQGMIGSVDEVRRETASRINALAPGGGYVLAAANNITSDVPLENVLALYENAKDLGQYPLRPPLS
ncbi:MAG: uroporphyrinogen decarboxylase family protein, partial [Phycisphaerae bacterium]|nr:uroporphyrinogen decarboxylase family protein [Phycisphaerae bacterium]